MYGSFGASERPATAPGGLKHHNNLFSDPLVTASSNVATRKCADDVDFETIVALSRQFTAELEVKQAEKSALLKVISDAKRAIARNSSILQKKESQLDRVGLESQSTEKKTLELEQGNIKLRQELASLLRANEKAAVEVETMTEQMRELLETAKTHRDQLESLNEMLKTYRREIAGEKRQRDEILNALRTHKTARNIMEERVDDVARRKHLLKTCIADVFVSSAV